MESTLKQIVEEFKTFTDNHFQAYDFGYGPITEINTKTLSFPMIWMSSAPSTMNMSYTVFNFDLYILDLTNSDQENLTDIMSSTQRIGKDILNYYKNSDIDEIFELSESIRFAPITMNFDHLLSGWNFSFEITVIDQDCNIAM